MSTTTPDRPTSAGDHRPSGTRRLGCYVMPGASRDPRAALTQARAAETLGLGSVWLSERWAAKELGSVCGAVAATTSEVRIVAGVTHFGTRHPVVLAGLGTTLQALSGGRFSLGIGRSMPALWPLLGLPAPTTVSMEDHARILQQLWRSETVSYSGPAGRYPALRATDSPDGDPPPLLLAAVGPNTLDLAGRVFDGVILHPFLSDEAVARARDVVRGAAVDAGRDPEAVRIYGQMVTVADADAATIDDLVAARALTYFEMRGLGDALFAANGWDPATLRGVREHPLMARVRTFADHDLSLDERSQVVRDTVPAEWIAQTSATGTADAVATRLADYLDAGLDELVLHGSTADQLGPVLDAIARQHRRSTWRQT
ncbi:MAG: hypothetical protein JWR63_1413 [Conexibacter sp.]|nr:hypothetical protein [Conexibacter sp.]